jgi:protein-L-isoaspartate(D-aspartate) O-methyltransferase
MRWRPFSRLARRAARPANADAVGDAADRRRMVREQIEARGIRNPELIRALLTVPRHAFLDDPAMRPDAYADRALAIASGQTISQPYVVAAMTDAARPHRASGWRGARVLEIGTGSGYQAAVLAELGARVVTIERHADLATHARQRLLEAGYGGDRVEVRVGDGTQGAPDAAPFDAILVTAAGPAVPGPLVAQLSPDGGILVMPVGTRATQRLTVVERRGDVVAERPTEQVVFVPLIGEHGFHEED